MKAVRGMHDLYGEEMRKWQFVENKTRAVLGGFGYQEIRTPVLEDIEVFSSTVGDETDIVQKQMYQVTKENETLVLRPEGTASFMRAVIEHQLHREAQCGRYFYYLPMFRHERPQKGRLRQFHQFGAEIINDATAEADAEIITVLDSIYKNFGINEYEIRVNSVGCSQCRPVYRDKLKAYFQPHLKELCEQCQKRFERSPLRILDCKNPTCQSLAENAPLITDSLCSDCRTHHHTLKERLAQVGISFIDDPKIVRGLDYYCRTAFEFTSSLLGAQSALCGGGRYDALSARFGEKPIPAVGFGLGMERLVIALESKNAFPNLSENPVFYFAPLGKAAFDTLYPMSIHLRQKQFMCEMPYDSQKSLKSHLKNSNHLQCQFTVILGEDEVKKGVALIKDMKKAEQEEVSLANLEQELFRRAKSAIETK